MLQGLSTHALVSRHYTASMHSVALAVTSWPQCYQVLATFAVRPWPHLLSAPGHICCQALATFAVSSWSQLLSGLNHFCCQFQATAAVRSWPHLLSAPGNSCCQVLATFAVSSWLQLLPGLGHICCQLSSMLHSSLHMCVCRGLVGPEKGLPHVREPLWLDVNAVRIRPANLPAMLPEAAEALAFFPDKPSSEEEQEQCSRQLPAQVRCALKLCIVLCMHMMQ